MGGGMQAVKNLPPFGKLLAERLKKKDHLNNDIYLFLGSSAWQRAKNFYIRGQAVLVLPIDDTPEIYNWPVRGCEVLVVITSELPAHVVELTAQALLSAGAEVARVLLAWSGQMPAIYRRSA